MNVDPEIVHLRPGLASLRKFLQKTRTPERCDLCSAAVPEQHQHLIDPRTRRFFCACNACAILFPGTGRTKYLRIPRDIFNLQNFNLTDQFWNSLAIPVGLVFFFRSSLSENPTALYPSPAGSTESAVDLECWQELVAENPVLERLQSDVEALLVNRLNGAREYFIAPIDECYKLAGLMRKHWRGFSGGEEAWAQVGQFFDALKRRAAPDRSGSHAGSQI